MPRSKDKQPDIPLLGPGVAEVESLMQYPNAVLREAAEKRGLSIPRSATRIELAHRLVRETIRRRADELYKQQDNTFISVDSSYPFLIQLIRAAQPRNIFDIGCGTALVANRLRKVLPPDGSYRGIDQVAAGVERAREVMSDDPRFHFDVGDAASVRVPAGSDLVLFCWVMTWLDTHSVDAIFTRLGKLPRDTTVITCVAFLTCGQKGGKPISDSRSFATARSYLLGEPAPGTADWDLTRYETYRSSLMRNFTISEQHVRPGANIFWVAKPRR